MRLQINLKQNAQLVKATLLIMGAGLMAIPSCTSYEGKVRLDDGLMFASAAKLAVVDYYVTNNNQLPQGSVQEIHRQLGLAEPKMISSSSVESVSVSNDGSVRVQYQPEVFENSSIVLKPNLSNVSVGGSITWTCKTQSEDKRFLRALPPECKN